MAGMTRERIAAIALLRLHLFANTIRTTRGQLELISRIIVGLLLLAGGVGGAFGFGTAAWYFVSHGNTEWLALLLWPVFAFWQLFPIFSAAFSETADSSTLLRYPLSYSAYFLVRMAYGAFDPTSLMGGLWLMGIGIGTSLAAPHVLPIVALTLLTFALFNLVLSRTIFAWLERWLAQRKTREILGVLFIGAILCIQLVGPLLRHYEHGNRGQMLRLVAEIVPAERVLPPGLAAAAIARSLEGRIRTGFLYFSVLCGYSAAAILLLSVRVRQEYRGENLSEAGTRAETAPAGNLANSWDLPAFSGPAALVMEKELRYLSRSGPMLFTLIVPLFMLLIFRSNGAFPHQKPDLVFPAVAAYTLILLTNLIYNNFGGDGTGIQFYFASPVEFREIVAGKNLAHVLILLLEIVVAWAGVSWIYKPPSADVMAATLAAILFAAPVNLATGNLLSLYFPKRIEASAFGRQRASPTTVLASFGIQVLVMGTAALVLWLNHGPTYWTASVIFLVLAACSLTGYLLGLARVDYIALARRENLMRELMRA